MLLYRGVPKEEIKKLKAGDFFYDSPIVNIQWRYNILYIVTQSGSSFTVHVKPNGYNIHKRTKKPSAK
jgi:hypothetical protein